MSSPIRPADWEHFSIVRESLSLDGLHVAMIGGDRRQLLDYAGALAVTLSEQDGWHIEKYDPDRLETLIVDLMLNRFDAALQTLSGHRSVPSPRPCRCALFIPDAQSLSSAAFQQLIRLAAGTRDQRLRLVAVFNRSGQSFEDRISAMGTQTARWDLDDNEGGDGRQGLFQGAMGHTLKPVTTGRRNHHPGRFLAATTVAVALIALSMIWPATSNISFNLPLDGQASTESGRVTTLAGTLGAESPPTTVPPERGSSKAVSHFDEQNDRSDKESAAHAEALRP